MSIALCSVHGTTHPGKLATVISWWYEQDGERVCYRQRLCAPSLTDIMDFRKNGEWAESSDVCVCPLCGKDSSPSLDAIYFNIYPPKQPEREYALTTCTSCAPQLRSRLLVGADKLPSRASVGAAAPTKTPETDWESVPW